MRPFSIGRRWPRRGELPLPRRSIRLFRRCGLFGDGAKACSPGSRRSRLGGLVAIPAAGNLIGPVDAILSLLKWGGAGPARALRGIERDPTAASVRARPNRPLRRSGAGRPHYGRLPGSGRRRSSSFRRWPPGRPRRIEAARDLQPGQPAAGPVRAGPPGDRAGAREAARGDLLRYRSGAGRRRVHRPGPPRPYHRRQAGRGQGASAQYRGGFRPRPRHLCLGRGAGGADGARGRSPEAESGHRLFQAMDGARARPSPRGGLGFRAARESGRGERFLRPRDRLDPNLAASADSRVDRRHQAHRPRSPSRAGPTSRRWPRSWSGPSSQSSTASSTPISTRAISSPFPTAALPRSTSGSWAGSTARPGCGWPRSSTAS